MTRPTLYRGSRGTAVLAARKRLAQRGYHTEHHDSQFFGQGLERATIAFQRHAGLKPDGVIGPHTWAALTHKPQHDDGRPSEAEQFALFCKRRATGRDGHPRPLYGHAEADLTKPFAARYLDCSELMQLGVYQTVHDTWVDGSYNQYPACKDIPVARALRTVGATVYLTDDNTRTGTIHHVGVVCKDQDKWMVAQMRTAYAPPDEQGGIWPADEQNWALAGLIRELRYS